MFADRQKQMLAILPKVITPERLMTLAMAAVQNTPKLMDCDQLSFVNAVIGAGRLGLEPDGLLGQAYLVPYKNKVQLITGYKGLLKLARNSGQISTIQAHAVYEKDHFTFCYGLDPKLEHTPTQEDDAGQIVAFYAVARLKDGSVQFEVMWRKQVDRVRNQSEGYRAFKDGKIRTNPWETHYDEMGKKTVLRRLCKMLPASVELQIAIQADDAADDGRTQEFDIDLIPDAEEGEGNESGNGSKLDAIVDADKEKQAAKTTNGGNQEASQKPATKEESKPKQTSKGKKEQPVAAAMEGNPTYSDKEPDPFTPGGDLFEREPGCDDV